jgi:hypothetical protein
MDAHLKHTRAQLTRYVTGATYLNFTHGDDRRHRAPSAYSPYHLARLRAIKDELDPDNRFGYGFGIAAS